MSDATRFKSRKQATKFNRKTEQSHNKGGKQQQKNRKAA